jgi:CubicO group peptidase (beta-lactamase class C family)
VRFHHLLDMATGNYNSPVPHKDEDSTAFLPFFTAVSSSEKTEFACTHFKRKRKPGKKWVYHTSDTYLLGVAMNAFLSEKRGEKSDYYEDLLLPLWGELGLGSLTKNMRRTTGAAPQPFTGYGMVVTADDMVRLGHALTQGSAVREALNTTELDAALQRARHERGLPAGGESLRYQNGFWA